MNLTRTLIIGMTTIALLAAATPAVDAKPLPPVPIECAPWLEPTCDTVFTDPRDLVGNPRDTAREACADSHDYVTGHDLCDRI